MKSKTYTSCAAIALFVSTSLAAQSNLGIANYNDNDELYFPANTDEWIFMGSSLGSEYGDEPFDPNNPGAIGVVKMEPSAYRYFLENNKYADGTMFLLSFFGAEAQSSPQLPGFVQGTLQAKEIHIIDSQRFSEGRGFYIYQADAGAGSASGKIPDGSDCVVCHMAEAQYEGTFTQFYPTVRHLIAD